MGICDICDDDDDEINKTSKKHENKKDQNIKNENIINEKIINDIIQNSTCQILKKEEKGFGFFCKIPFLIKKNYNLVNALITNIKMENIESKKIIVLYNNSHHQIIIDNDTKIYRDEKKYDITIIEIKEGLNKYSFLEIDDDIKNISNNSQKTQVCSIYYTNEGKISYDFGFITKHHNNNFIFKSEKKNERGKGGLILSLKNYKVLGIKKIQSNECILFKEPLIPIPITEVNNNIMKKSINNNLDNNNQNNNIINNSITPDGIQNNNNELNTNININKTGVGTLNNNLTNDNKNINQESNNINLNDYNPYIKALLVSFYKIINLKPELSKDYNSIKLKNFEISYLLSRYIMNYNNKNFLGCKQDILDLEKKIKIIQKDDTILSNFGKLIDFILNQLHKELNRKQKLNTNAPKGDYDEIISYITFKKWFSEQNESIIQKYFFGIIERIELYNCCGLKKYNFDLFKYLFFNTDKDKKEGSIDLQYLINNMENSPIIFKNNCSMCCITSKALVQQRFFDNPIILIIIINNKKKKQINFSENIHTKKYEYKLLCYVTEPENKMDFKIFNIFYIENKKWSVIKTNDDIISKIVGNEIDSLSNYPCILFYERRNLIKKSSKLGNSIGSNSNYNPFYNSNNFIKANNNINGSQQIILNNINLTGSNHTHNLPIAFNNNFLINNYLTNNNNINNTNILNSPNGQYHKKIQVINLNKKTNNIHNNKRSKFENSLNKQNITNYNLNKYFFNQNNSFNNINNPNNNVIFLTDINGYNFNNYNLSTINHPQTFIAQNNGKLNNYIIQNNNINYSKTSFNNHNKKIINGQLNNKNIHNSNNKHNIKIQTNKNIIGNPNPNSFSLVPNIFMNNNNVTKNENNINDESEEITLFFVFSNEKEIYLDVKQSYTFKEVIKQLSNKYDWVTKLKIINYKFNGKIIDYNKTVKEIGLKDKSKIKVNLA